MAKQSTALVPDVIYPNNGNKSYSSTDLKVWREQRKIKQLEADNSLIKTLIDNPAVDILAAYIILEILQQNGITSGGLVGGFEQGAVMTGVVTAVSLKSIAPVLPDIIKAGSEGLAALMKIVPMLATMGG